MINRKEKGETKFGFGKSIWDVSFIVKFLRSAGESEIRSVPAGEEQKRYAPPHT